jgi:hypothetical protein
VPNTAKINTNEGAMMGFDIKKLLGTIAPMLGTALGGPLGGAAASLIVGKLGGNTDPKDPAAVQEALAQAVMTPDGLAKLKEAEMDFQLQMKSLDIKSVYDLEKLEQDDRSNARSREVSLRDKFVPVLATVVVGAFFLTVLAILRGWGKVEAAFAGTLVGYLAANANQVVSYYFGSSAGSAQKSELLAKQGDK